ncbi:MAG TPA: S41 family peptidase [Edaphocola sp.]|nr:S41 family peptidase [Edaphocola sp.]
MPHQFQELRKKNIWLPLLLSIVLIAGLVGGFYLSKILGTKRDFSTIMDRNDRLGEMIDVISEKYVDSISSDSLYNDAISGILHHLDPHTSYIPAKDLDLVNANLDGNFSGVGLEYQIVFDTPMISMITPNSPAFISGAETGDLIIKINDTIVAGVNITKKELVRRVRKSKVSLVSFEVYRPIENKTISLKINKGDVEINSIDAAYMIDKETGYIRIKRFAGNTYEEFKEELEALKEAGMKKLIVDLRNNGGGYLQAAVNIADEFLSGNKLIVYTYGSKIGRENYAAYRNGAFENGRLMIVVDENSASASEILAGAIQDWDRGIVLGRQTYGKGLVQEQFELGDGAALRITIARYYTPVGRSIQKSYSEGRDRYFWDKDHIRTESPSAIASGSSFYTSLNKRKVYGGGGIYPDINIPRNQEHYSKTLAEIISSPKLDAFIYQYYAQNPKKFKSISSFKEFDQEVGFGGTLGKELDKICTQISPLYTTVVKANKNEKKLLEAFVKGTLARIQFNNEGYFMIINRTDKLLKRAYEVINSDEYSKIIRGDTVQPTE